MIKKKVNSKQDDRQYISLKRLYYTPFSYLLLATVAIWVTWSIAAPFALQARMDAGRPAYNPGEWGYYKIAATIFIATIINLAYPIAAFLSSTGAKGERTKHILFNTGIVLVIVSCLVVAGIYINEVVHAPVNGSPSLTF